MKPRNKTNVVDFLGVMKNAVKMDVDTLTGVNQKEKSSMLMSTKIERSGWSTSTIQKVQDG